MCQYAPVVAVRVILYSMSMLTDRLLFKFVCYISDRRVRALKAPADVERRVDIPYGIYGKWNLLDVYYPEGTDRPLPVIVSIHGGGYVYGSKNLYQYYCMDLARRGFTVINFNYRLVPQASFPQPVIETNEVMAWACANASEFFIDTENVFFVGDSAGAQIASQYCAAVTNPQYAALLGLSIPAFRLKAVALNCGMYEKPYDMHSPLPGLLKDYFGKDPQKYGDKIDVLKFINGNFPPAFVMSSANDFLLPHARPMFEYLRQKGIEAVLEVYGTKKQKKINHVFHLKIFTQAAQECNDDQCGFFRKFIS